MRLARDGEDDRSAALATYAAVANAVGAALNAWMGLALIRDAAQA